MGQIKVKIVCILDVYMDIRIKRAISSFEDVSVLMLKLKEAKKIENRIKRRLKTKLMRYDFLDKIIGINTHKNELVYSIELFFKSLGLKTEGVPENLGNEDMRIWFDNTLMIVEITGTKKNSTEDKTHQISKHIPERKSNYPSLDVKGLFITNHNNDVDVGKRSKNPFTKRQGKFAKDHGYIITTTITLFFSYLSIKSGSMSLDDFKRNISTPGEFILNKVG